MRCSSERAAHAYKSMICFSRRSTDFDQLRHTSTAEWRSGQRVGLITQRSVDRNHAPLFLQINAWCWHCFSMGRAQSNARYGEATPATTTTPITSASADSHAHDKAKASTTQLHAKGHLQEQRPTHNWRKRRRRIVQTQQRQPTPRQQKRPATTTYVTTTAAHNTTTAATTAAAPHQQQNEPHTATHHSTTQRKHTNATTRNTTHTQN